MTRNHSQNAAKTRNSQCYKKAISKAQDYINHPDKLVKLVSDATEKSTRKSTRLTEVWGSLMACIRLVKAYANGSYRGTPWQSLILIIASIIYFVIPTDLIPDIIVGLGFLDDAALLKWTFDSCASDIKSFIEWENKIA